MAVRKMLVPLAMLVLIVGAVSGYTAPQNPALPPPAPATVVDRGAPGELTTAILDRLDT